MTTKTMKEEKLPSPSFFSLNKKSSSYNYTSITTMSMFLHLLQILLLSLSLSLSLSLASSIQNDFQSKLSTKTTFSLRLVPIFNDSY